MNKKRLALALCGLLVLPAAVAWIVWTGAHGSEIPAAYAPNLGADFDFGRPPCEPSARPAAAGGEVLVRYLGTSGLYVERDGTAVMTAPFFSNPGLLRTGLGRLSWRDAAIRAGLAGLTLDRVEAVLVGHAHYDHVGDLPRVLPLLDPRARLLANRTAANMLAACEGAAGRWIDVEPRLGDWIAVGARLRVMPLQSSHAPHVGSLHLLGRGNVERSWDDCDWERRRLASMPSGRVIAYLIDFLGRDGGVRFRVHFQDAASGSPRGTPPAGPIVERPVDLAVVCMASAWLVTGYPEEVLAATRARHVLVTHYEDFFRPHGVALRFAPLLTNRRAEEFMARTAEEMSRAAHDVLPPRDPVCGPASDSWSMPLPGEWLRFGPDERALPPSSGRNG